MIALTIWWKQNCPPNNHVYQMVNILQEMSTKSGMIKYI